MKFIDFFAGIGGFRRGLELAGHKCIGFCELDKYAIASYTSMHLITDRQREYLAAMPLQKRQKEILKDEYRNGEWFAGDICGVDARSLPRADCWCFGSPCTNFSMAGRREGLKGNKSSLIQEIFRLLEEQHEEDRPEWLIYENVTGMFSSNGGLDYLSILSELDGLGFDCEWQNINSAQFVPQNRQRIYTIGHNRRYGSAKIFPVKGTDGQNNVYQIGMRISERKNKNQYRLYDVTGISPTLNTMNGGGREPDIALFLSIDNYKNLSPKRENIYVKINDNLKVYAVWYEKKQCYVTMRKLTPKECFRLQGWEDKYFDRAQFVNSDSQLYKQAGNGVTVPVVEAIGRKLKEYKEGSEDLSTE